MELTTYVGEAVNMLMCRIMPDEQVPFWTATHGEMISSDLHGAEESIRWMLRPHQELEIGQRWIRGFPPEKRRTFHQRHPGRA
jgi:hypothetical protein